ncbi:MAG: hypothetical protein KDA78_02525 [Planctomycetaceae bacterium]|nr:hypothetical protein [Planctomycetaceae bacterium]
MMMKLDFPFFSGRFQSATLWILESVLHPAALVLLGSAFLISLSGCNGGSKSDSPPAQANSGKANPSETSSGDQSASPSESEGSPKKPGQKYVDGIPYDVFFDRPLSVAAENTSPPAMSVTENPTPGNTTPDNKMASNNPPATTPPSQTTPPAATGAQSWENIMKKDALLDQITQLRNTLTANVNSVGSFNRELLAIQIDAATLAALAGVAGQMQDDFTWKPKAPAVRDAASEIAVAAETRGRPSFEIAEKNFLNIVEILNGGTPAELPESNPETVFSDVADRNLLMKKIKIHADWSRTTVSDEATLKSEKEEVMSRAALLRLLGEVVNLNDYVFAEEKDYKTFCQELIDGARQMYEGAEKDDYNLYSTGFELFNKSCNDCHPVYLNN